MAAIPLGWLFLSAMVTLALAAYIAIVGIGYSLLLRHTWDPEGLQKVADILLHDAVPVMFVGCWLIALPKADCPGKVCFSGLSTHSFISVSL